jgi:hypothetical protein
LFAAWFSVIGKRWLDFVDAGSWGKVPAARQLATPLTIKS